MIGASQGRLQDRRPVSIIDIGSNSIRLVIYEGIARSPTVLFNEKMLAGLGRGIVSTGKLDPEAVLRSMEEFRRFRALSEQAGAEQLYVIATAAAREAVNGPQPLMDALMKLSADHLSHPMPHPFYVGLHYSHPPLEQRLAALEAARP